MDLFLIILRGWIFGKIGYGVRRIYSFVVLGNKNTLKKKKNEISNDFGDEIIGFIVLALILVLAQYLI